MGPAAERWSSSTKAHADEDELKDYVKENLAAYKVPREIAFVDALPRKPQEKS